MKYEVTFMRYGPPAIQAEIENPDSGEKKFFLSRDDGSFICVASTEEERDWMVAVLRRAGANEVRSKAV
jgi:hypothetical protein